MTNRSPLNDPFDHPFFTGTHADFNRPLVRKRTVAGILGLWLLIVLLNVVFWGSLIALGFYAVNKFS